MHISEGVLSGPVLLSGAALAAAGTAVGLKKLDYDQIVKAGMLSGAFFIACVRVCPTQATYRRADGVVIMDMLRCIGCALLHGGLPLLGPGLQLAGPPARRQGSPPGLPHPGDRGGGKECNFCAERLARGQMPACVEASKGALIFGDLAEAKSPARETLKSYFTIRRKPYLGTNPQVYYIV